ncbi:MAG: hypothetical protein Q8K33_01535 [Cypionkella sp.]|uniref:hypothetical protein n=1 Tax=Cypionkella sp. TaxID=2811411 RepID=UPI00272EFA08|nr:hypothetical protein [Cypionkella sp.]MDP2047563.1 hypothetical protein [Cypionkella sp.]
MSAIIMKCLLIRAGGTKIDLDGVNYHFKDDGLGNHVATISDMKHVSKLAGIPEAYEVFGSAPATDTAIGLGVTLTAAQSEATSAGPIAPVAAPVVEAPVAPVAATADPEMQTTANAQAGFPENMSIGDLRALFLAEVGREPSPKAKPETMMAGIIAIRAERAGQ